MSQDAIRRVLAEAQRRNMTRAGMARLLRVSPQTLHNWVGRGLPTAAAPEVARNLGWSVDYLLYGHRHPGVEPAELTDFQRRLLALWSYLTPEQEQEYLDNLRALVEANQRVAAYLGQRELHTAAEGRVADAYGPTPHRERKKHP